MEALTAFANCRDLQVRSGMLRRASLSALICRAIARKHPARILKKTQSEGAIQPSP
jgi:hypothetical protein